MFLRVAVVWSVMSQFSVDYNYSLTYTYAYPYGIENW